MAKKYLLNLFTMTVASLLFAGAAVAETTYKSHAALKTDLQSVDWNGGKISVGSLKGVVKIYGSSSSKMPNGDQIQDCLMRVAKMANGTEILTNCSVTDKDGDILHSISERKQGDLSTGGKGKTRYVGGTGKYQGASGGCEYTANYLPGGWLSVDSDCKMD